LTILVTETRILSTAQPNICLALEDQRQSRASAKIIACALAQTSLEGRTELTPTAFPKCRRRWFLSLADQLETQMRMLSDAT